MERANRKKTAIRVFGLCALIVGGVELALCFTGPFAFTHKPTIMVFPPFASNTSDEQAERVSAFMEREIAMTGSYSIVGRSFIEEYFIRTDPDGDRDRLAPLNAKEAEEIAQDLGLERYVIATLWHWSGRWELNITIRSARDGLRLRSARYATDTFDNLIDGRDDKGVPFAMQEDLAVELKGIGIGEVLVLLLLALQCGLGLLAMAGRDPGVLVDVVLAPAVVLFLFAYIHALSANMDYVQRYIATGGQLRLAQSTAQEQLYAVLRYGPVLLLNAGFYLFQRLRPRTALGRFAVGPGLFRQSSNHLLQVVARWAFPLVLLSAGLFAFSFPSFLRLGGLAPLAWISLVPLFLVLISSKPAMSVLYGVVFGTLQALIINYWHGTYNYVTLHLITIALAVEYLMFMLPLVLIIKCSGKWGFLPAAAAWAAFDYLRSVGILGYPWGLIGTTQYQFLPLIQIASVTGVWGVGFVVLLANASLAWALAAPGRSWRWLPASLWMDLSRSRPGMHRMLVGLRRYLGMAPIALFALIFSFCLIAGGAILRSSRARIDGARGESEATIVLIQHNTDPRKREYRENFLALAELTDAALATLPEPPDLVAWPEGGFILDTRYWTEPKNKNSYWGRVVGEFLDYQRGLGTWLMTGTQDHETVIGEEGETSTLLYNSSLLLDPEGGFNSFYHKMRLVPFSEHFPLDKEKFAALYEVFEEYDISNWTVGEGRSVHQHEKLGIVTPICFEDVFSDHVRRFMSQGVDIILNMSNDYWSLSPVEGTQHGILGIFRAVENQRPMMRATSSGYTLYVDATGAVQPGSPEPYTAGYQIARVPIPERHLTFYSRHGDWFPIVCAVFVFVCLVFAGALALVRRGRVIGLQRWVADPRSEKWAV